MANISLAKLNERAFTGIGYFDAEKNCHCN
jgi:hypothetical protein